MEIVLGGRAPDAGLAGRPQLGPLRGVVVPGARLEIAELLVHHLIELAEELDHLVVVVAMIGGDIVPRTVAQRPPDDRDSLLAHDLARVLQMHEVFELERDVMELHVWPGEEVHGVMIAVAAHEAEEIPDPVGDAEAEHLLVERHGALDVGREEGDVPELERPDAGDLRVLAEIAPVLEQLDGGALVVLERQHLAHAGNRIIAQLAAHAVLGELARQLAEVGIGRDLERQLDAVSPVGLVELDHELPDLGGEKRAILFALGHDQPHKLVVVRDRLFQVRRLEGGMADSSRLDHDWLPYRNSNGAAGHWSPPLPASPYRRSPAGATLQGGEIWRKLRN